MDFSSIIHFLTDKTRNLSSKALFIVFGFILLIFLDNTFSFSYYYNTSQKVTQIKEINEGLKDSTFSVSEKKKLLKLRTELIEHKTLKDKVYDYLTNLNFETSDEEATETVETVELEAKRNSRIHFITSAWWLVLSFGIILIALPFVLLTERKDIFATLLGFIFLGGFAYLIALLLSKVFSFIPLIDNNPMYNYILNVILSGIILLLMLLAGKKKKTTANTV
ncbi:DUF4131 domain-containing protein [Winogradskyella luteola]|uniref:Uncharacterized protein n=1 Tax=Winogradskyella luteola TaxID=2828330 RepID=A0A9X1FCW5_9FLAO|nr:DUF4131 domain-containing protein [Winogradskyella luteola]MBV7270560.1 hypothetical protein [Winogradskyella luteola]